MRDKQQSLQIIVTIGRLFQKFKSPEIYSFSTAGHTIAVENNPTQFLYSKLRAVSLYQSSTKDTAATNIKRKKG